MQSGIQVWDASGHLIVDITDRLARFISMTRVDGQNPNGQISDSRLLQGEPFYSFQQEKVWGYNNMDISRPVFTIAGQTISWVYSPAATQYNQRISGLLYYGVR